LGVSVKPNSFKRVISDSLDSLSARTCTIFTVWWLWPYGLWWW